MKTSFKRISNDQRGATSVEYGFIVAMIVIGLISAVKGLADENTGMWATVQSKSAEAVKG